MNAKSEWKQGQKVNGIYCGKAYSGRITRDTRPTPDYRHMIFSVSLDNAVFVFGQTRERIEVWTNGSDTISAT